MLPRRRSSWPKRPAMPSSTATVEAPPADGPGPQACRPAGARRCACCPRVPARQVRILVFAEGEAEKIARDAGADYVGSDELIDKIQKGWFDFDMAIATPPMMRKVGRLGRVLGPRGLMPSPKAGTIVTEDDLERVIREARQGRVEYRVDKTANIHVPVGKASFATEDLVENMAAVMEAIVKARPAASKGTYIRKVTICNTMGPGIRVDPMAASAMKTA